MAITDLIKRTILAEFRADISQAGREIDALIAKHEKLGASAQSAARNQSAHFDQLVLDLTRSNRGAQEASVSWDGWKKKADESKMSSEQLFGALAKGAVVLGTVAAAVDFGRDSLKSYGETLRLETKAAGVNIDQLSESFDGLISHHDLLTFAAQSSTGVLKLNQQQMETIGQAAVALRDRGYDLSESFEKLKDAAVKGKVEGLDDLGLSIKAGESNAQTLKNMMTELNKVIAENGGRSGTAADEVDRLAVAWDNAKEKVKNYAAQAILAASVDVSPESLKKRYIENGWDQFRAQFPTTTAYERQRAYIGGYLKGQKTTADQSIIEMDDLNVARTDAERKKMAEDAATEAANAILRAAVASTERNIIGVRKDGTYAYGQGVGYNSDPTKGGYGLGNLLGKTSLGTAADSTIRDANGVEQDYVGDAIRRTDEFNQSVRDYGASKSDRTQSYLETMFGPIEEFKAYETAFGTLQTAVGSAMGAWISGSLTLGQAIKKGVGDALGALASKLAAHAIEHTLFAAGSIAFGDVAGAARHAAAAAAFGAGAATVATIARSMNGSVSSTAAPNGGGAGSGGGGAGSAGTTDTNAGPVVRDHRENQPSTGPIYFIVGEHFAQESPRQKAIDAEDTMRRAFGGSGSRDG